MCFLTATAVTHQSVKKSGVDVASDEASGGLSASNHTGKFDVTALSLAVAALFTVPLVVAVVVVLCVRQCKPSKYSPHLSLFRYVFGNFMGAPAWGYAWGNFAKTVHRYNLRLTSAFVETYHVSDVQ